LRAQFDVAQGRVAQALAAVQKSAGELPSGPTWAARVLDGLIQKYPELAANPSLIEATCQLYRDACLRDPNQRGLFVQFLGSHGRTTEALEICQTWRKEGPSAVALAAAAAAVSQPGAPAGDTSRVEEAIRDELRKSHKTPLISTALGTLLESHAQSPADFHQAVDAYRKGLETDPKDVIALNNLALLLAFQDQSGDEALQLINKAIDTVGPIAALLDTRGSIQLCGSGLESKALDDFSHAVAVQPTATRWFHVAQAQLRLKNLAEAKQAYKQALALGLSEQQLHFLERDRLTKLSSQLAPKE
jgi:tetratricopeptide (TPR) repeat protein